MCVLLLFLIIACADDKSLPNDRTNSRVIKTVTVDVNEKFQIMDGFGASDCWTANYVGRDWTIDQKESIARLLFSKEICQGKPQGIGLSMWRFNLGAGTAEQGNDSGIQDKSRRSESFLNADGSYNWNRQQGQLFFLQKARDYGCEAFVMFSNSPPVYYTYNGLGYSNRGSFSNLKREYYRDFAEYMATVASHFKDSHNIHFSYISPVNEPQYNWNEPNQEGSGWQNDEIRHLVVELDQALARRALDTKILITEAGDWEYLYKVKNDPGRSNQMEVFFSKESENYIGDLTHVPLLIGGHSYWTDGNWDKLKQVRTELRSKSLSYGLELYQTEWSMLGDHYDDVHYPGNETSSHLDIALHMSKVIHHDLISANVSSWSYWTSMDLDRWNHKSRFLLIQLNPAEGPYGDISQSGTHAPMKNLWVLGNYSLFIRPGFQRIALEINNPSSSFFGSAWISSSMDEIVFVFTNMTSGVLQANIGINGTNNKPLSIKRYVTSSSKNLEENVVVEDDLVVDPESVTTFVVQF